LIAYLQMEVNGSDKDKSGHFSLKSRLVNWAGVFQGIALYAPQHSAKTLCLHRPQLDDIPAVGDPVFPSNR
jgi:hypothetical protein